MRTKRNMPQGLRIMTFEQRPTDPETRTNRLLPLAGKPAGRLLIHEIYRSIQGESTFAGLPCVFVRLAVCDARCSWCDTPHAFTQGTAWTLEEILDKVQGYQTGL